MATPVFPSMAAGAQDAMQPLLVKIAYQLQVAAEALGGADASMPYATMVPGPFDTQQVLLVKIAYWAKQVADNGGGGGGGSGITFDTAAGPPPTDGSILKQGYKDSSSGIKYINTAWPSTAAPTWEPF